MWLSRLSTRSCYCSGLGLIPAGDFCMLWAQPRKEEREMANKQTGKCTAAWWYFAPRGKVRPDGGGVMVGATGEGGPGDNVQKSVCKGPGEEWHVVKDRQGGQCGRSGVTNGQGLERRSGGSQGPGGTGEGTLLASSR